MRWFLRGRRGARPRIVRLRLAGLLVLDLVVVLVLVLRPRIWLHPMLPTRLPKPCGGQGRKTEDEIEDEIEDERRTEPDSHHQGSHSVMPWPRPWPQAGGGVDGPFSRLQRPSAHGHSQPVRASVSYCVPMGYGHRFSEAAGGRWWPFLEGARPRTPIFPRERPGIGLSVVWRCACRARGRMLRGPK